MEHSPSSSAGPDDERHSGASRLQALKRHLKCARGATSNRSSSTGACGMSTGSGSLPPIVDPYPDPGDYRGKAQPFRPKPTAGQCHGGTDEASAAPAPVLTPNDHDHFLRTGYIHLKGVIPPESVAHALENIQRPRPDCSRLHAAVRELLGPHYRLDLPTTSGGYDMPRAPLSPTEHPAEYATAVDGSNSAKIVTQGRAHCDDAYGTLMPQGWVLGSFIFLTSVESRGGAFIIYPGSYLRYRDAMSTIGPGGYKGIAPEFGGDLMEVLAEPGDAVIFHHLMGHSGSHNVASLHTRHALLNRYHPATRFAPPPERTLEEMSTLERANSARYLQKAFGIGRCLSPSAAPQFFNLPQLQDQPVYTAFFLYGCFELWVVPAHSQCSLLRYTSDDLQVWTSASAPALPENVTDTLSSGSKIVDLQFHHYDLEAVMSLCVVDADGKNDRCLLLESFADDMRTTTDAASECAPPCARWRVIGIITNAGISKIRPFNAYAGYPSEVAVGQALYYVRADRPNELLCSWGGPANRVGGNVPADGEWQPVVEEVCSACATALEPNHEEGLGRARPRIWYGEKTTIALRTEDTAASPAGSVNAGAAAIDDVTVAARWGDSACSFVLDLQSQPHLDSAGAHYALPGDIALANSSAHGPDGKQSRALENPDQILAEETAGSTTLWPLRRASASSTTDMEQQTRADCVAATVWRVRVLMRARSFWLVSYLTCKFDEADKSNNCWQLEIGTIDWATDVPAVIRPVDSKAKLESAFAIVGWA